MRWTNTTAENPRQPLKIRRLAQKCHPGKQTPYPHRHQPKNAAIGQTKAAARRPPLMFTPEFLKGFEE